MREHFVVEQQQQNPEYDMGLLLNVKLLTEYLQSLEFKPQ